MKDYFAIKAKDYDKEKRRVDNVDNIANLILKNIKFSKNSSIADFGSGTGLLLERLAPYVKKITAIDISKSMNEVLRQKSLPCQLEIKQIDLTKQDINQKFDAIVSSMTIHHIKDVEALFKKFYNMLKDNGSIAIADLDKEDGTFHSIDTGVEHFGFDRDEFINYAKKAGFRDIKIYDVGDVIKPYGAYGVFLLTAKKC